MPRRKHAADLPPSSDSESDSASNANANANLGSNPIVNSLERLGKPLPKLVAFDLVSFGRLCGALALALVRPVWTRAGEARELG